MMSPMSNDDHEPKTAFLRNRRYCFRLLDQLDELLSYPGEPDVRDVGDIVEARYHLEHAVRYLSTLGESTRGSKRQSKTFQDSVGRDRVPTQVRSDNARKERRKERRRKRRGGT